MAETKSTENRVDDWVRTKLDNAKVNAYEQHDLPETLTAVFKGGSKTGNKGGGIPDFTVFFERYGTLVVIENKYFLNKHIKLRGEKVDTSAKAVKDYAVNGAVHYARHAINHDDIQDVIAIGISGESTESSGSSRLADNEVNVAAYYVFDPDHEPTEIQVNKNFADFTLRNFPDFYQQLSISDADREQILKKNQADLKKSASELNKLFNDNSVSVENRVTILAGCLLAMMDRPYSTTYGPTRKGLRPEGLRGIPQGDFSDGNTIYKHVEEIMNIVREREPKQGRIDMILSSFMPLKVDTDRDIVDEERSVKLTGKNRGVIKDRMSTNKQIFTYIYENVFKFIEKTSHIDHLGAMYSEFLKYALGDGKDNGIVLTPPYVTAAMAMMIDVNAESRVFDPCTGSAGFLVSAMNVMIEDVNNDLDLTDEEKEEAIFNIKYEQLLGVEKDLKMYGLAVTNMILRGDGYSRILKGDSFKLIREEGSEIQQFKPDKALLNPPFSYSENGMPFVYETLEIMEKGGDMAVIIQDSAGTGQATKTNKRILAHHTLVASIRMPGDLFIPTAGVQTSIYIFEAGTPHDFKKDVLFVDFSDDGYKRTKRGTREIGDPETRYAQLLEIMKYRKPVEGSDIDVILDTVSDSGNDWNYTQHKVYDTVATEEDFLLGAAKFMSFELDMILQGKGALVGFPDELLEEVDAELEKVDAELDTQGRLDEPQGGFREFLIGEEFDLTSTNSGIDKNKILYGDNNLVPYVTRSEFNNGIAMMIPKEQNAKYEVNRGNCIAIGLDTQTATYQETEFHTGQNVHVLRHPKMQKTNAQYIVENLKKVMQKFNWGGNGATLGRLREETITLPATKDGTPDWDYMEEYMNHILKTQRESEELRHRKEETILRKLVSLREN